MAAVVLGIVVAGLATLIAFAVVWARWAVRDRRRRRDRLDERRHANDELERALHAHVRVLTREPDPWPTLEWLEENMPRALELCPYKVARG